MAANSRMIESDRAVFVDSHAHIELPPLMNEIEGVLRRASMAGVAAIVCVGIDLDDAKRTLEIVDRFDQVFACLGFHPHSAKEVGEHGLAEMENLAQHPRVVGYGEIGLDFFRNLSPKDVQKGVFRDQISLAKSLAKPIVVHLRNAYDEGLRMLEQAVPFPQGGVIHCFSGDSNHAARALALGFHVSIPGAVTYKKNDGLRSIVKSLPAEKILLETDCPFLAPEPLRGRDNEPANIIYTAKKVASVRNVSVKEIAWTTTNNAMRLFGLPTRIVEYTAEVVDPPAPYT